MSSTEIAKGFKKTNPGNLDEWYGPYANTSTASAQVPSAIRLGKVVGINTPEGIVDYWWKSGTADFQLIEKVISEDKIVKDTDIIIVDDLEDDPENTLIRGSIVKGNHQVIGGVYSVTTSNNWIRYPKQNIGENVKVRIAGTFLASGSGLAYFFGPGDVYLSQVLANGSNDQEFRTPVGTVQFAFNIAGKVDVAITPNPQDNEYAISARLYVITPGSGIETIKGQKIVAGYLSETIEFTGPVVKETSPVTLGYFNANKTPSNLFYDGEAFPDNDFGKDGDKYVDTRSGRLYLKKNGDWGSGLNMGGIDTPMSYPAGFPWQPVTLLRQSNGFVMPSIYDPQVFAQTHINSLTRGWVDPFSGLDTNDGTEGAPVKTVTRSIALGYRLHILKPGLYGKEEQLNNYTDTGSGPFIIIPEVPGTVSFAGSDNGNEYVWTKDPDYNVYSTSRTNLVNVIDQKELTNEGYYISYTKVATLALVRTTPKSWCYVGSVIHIHTSDGNAPNASVHVLFGNVPAPRFVLGPATSYVFIGGITFYNSSNTASQLDIRNDVTTQHNGKVYLKNLRFNKAQGGNGLSIDNIKEAWVANCKGSDALRDVLNYHTSLKISKSYIPMKVVEINGFSRRTGQGPVDESSSNGSTTHEGITIIRFGGDFAVASGPVIADISDGARSLIFNAIANDSTFNFAGSFYCQGVDSKMWLYGCSAKGSPYGAKAIDGATIYYDEFTRLSGTVATSLGDVIAI